MMSQGAPIFLIANDKKQTTGKEAMKNNIQAAKAVADAVRSTLGPKGMDKMLVDSVGNVIITNDGVTILKQIDVEHPAAKIIVEVSKSQDSECGDGTTSAVIIAGELLKNAEELIDQNIHPSIITRAYSMASEKAIEVLRKNAEDVSINDVDILTNIAKTAMTGKHAENFNKTLSTIAVNAIRMAGNKDNIKVQKAIGPMGQTELINGIIINGHRVNPNMPEIVTSGKIALLNVALELHKGDIDKKFTINDPKQLQAFMDEEINMLKKQVKLIKDSGANVVISAKGIDDNIQSMLSKAGIFAVRRSNDADLEKIAKATGGRIVTDLEDLTSNDLGLADVQEKKIGDNKVVYITNCKNPKAVTIQIYGGTPHIVDELERALIDALSVVEGAIKNGKITVGGGAAAMEISLALREFASQTGGREEMAINAYANAIEIIPKTLAQNSGVDAIDTIIELRKSHKKGNKNNGLNVYTGEIDDMRALNVIEPIGIGVQAISAASDAAIMIIRIDDIIAAAQAGPGPGVSQMPEGRGAGAF